MRLFLHDSLLDRTNVDGALDVAQTIALGALAAVPVIGLILREVVGTAFAELRFERVERFAAELSTDMTALGARIDRDFVRREEFDALTEQVLESVLQRGMRKRLLPLLRCWRTRPRNNARLLRIGFAISMTLTPYGPPRSRFYGDLPRVRRIGPALLMSSLLGRL